MKRSWILWVLLALFAVVIALNWAEIRGGLAEALTASWPWLLLAAVLLVGRYIIDALLFVLAFAIVGVAANLRQLVPVVYASLFVNLAGIGASGALLVDNAARGGQSAARATAGILLVLVADYTGFFVFLTGGLTYLALVGALQVYQLVFAAIFLLYIGIPAAALLLGLPFPRQLRALLHSVQRIVNRAAHRFGRDAILSEDWAERNAANFTTAARAAAALPGPMATVFAVALLFHFVEYLGTYAVVRSFGQPVSPLGVLAGYAVGLLFWIVGFTPQGIGVVESVMALTFISLGVATSAAIAISLVFRGLSFWLPLVIGLVFATRVPSLRR